jgi:hypothetical protein
MADVFGRNWISFIILYICGVFLSRRQVSFVAEFWQFSVNFVIARSSSCGLVTAYTVLRNFVSFVFQTILLPVYSSLTPWLKTIGRNIYPNHKLCGKFECSIWVFHCWDILRLNISEGSAYTGNTNHSYRFLTYKEQCEVPWLYKLSYAKALSYMVRQNICSCLVLSVLAIFSELWFHNVYLLKSLKTTSYNPTGRTCLYLRAKAVSPLPCIRNENLKKLF